MRDDNPSAADEFGVIADEFVDAFRQGKNPSVEEFARRYPKQADEIHEILPALVLMEAAKGEDRRLGWWGIRSHADRSLSGRALTG